MFYFLPVQLKIKLSQNAYKTFWQLKYLEKLGTLDCIILLK